MFAAATKTVGTLVHRAGRNIEWRLVGLLAVGSVPSTVLVLALMSWVNLDGVAVRQGLNLALGIVLLITSAFLLSARSLRERYAKRVERLPDRAVRDLTVLLGVAMGH